jgi:hypothetical protein
MAVVAGVARVEMWLVPEVRRTKQARVVVAVAVLPVVI